MVSGVQAVYAVLGGLGLAVFAAGLYGRGSWRPPSFLRQQGAAWRTRTPSISGRGRLGHRQRGPRRIRGCNRHVSNSRWSSQSSDMPATRTLDLREINRAPTWP